VSAKAHELGWQFSDADGHIEQQFKAMMFGSAGLSGDETVINAAKDMFKKLMAGDKTAVHPNIRGSVFSMALKYGGTEEVCFLHWLAIVPALTARIVRRGYQLLPHLDQQRRAQHCPALPGSGQGARAH
jgi:hypothetical protein